MEKAENIRKELGHMAITILSPSACNTGGCMNRNGLEERATLVVINL